MQVSEAAWDLLAVMDEPAALANQKIDLFTSQERFPGVFEAHASLAAAEKALVWRPQARLSSEHILACGGHQNSSWRVVMLAKVHAVSK